MNIKNSKRIYKKFFSLKYLIPFFFCETIGNSLRIEACSMCQLKCPVCSTGIGLNKNNVIGWGYLKFSDFKKIIDENPWIKNVELSNYGEIFLNPELKEIIKYAYSKDISLTALNGVNLNDVEEETLEYLIKYKFKAISVSIDGATNETYQIYRRGGDLKKVIKNIEKINFYKKIYNSEYPLLYWKFIVFGHNENEINSAREIAKSLNMEFRIKFNHTPSYSPVRNKEYVRKENEFGVASREEFKEKTKKEYKLPCYQLWISPQVNWDGKVLGCCKNKYSDFGNAFEKGLKDILRSEKYLYAKKLLIGLVKKKREDIPCFRCSVYKKLKNPFAIFEKIISFI